MESPSDQGRGTKWSVAGEAVWCGGDGGLWRCKGWETSGSQTPTKTGAAGGQTPSAAWAGTAHLPEQRQYVRGCGCCLAPTLRRWVWLAQTDTRSASSRNGCFLDARNTSGGIHPGRGVKE